LSAAVFTTAPTVAQPHPYANSPDRRLRRLAPGVLDHRRGFARRTLSPAAASPVATEGAHGPGATARSLIGKGGRKSQGVARLLVPLNRLFPAPTRGQGVSTEKGGA